VGIVLSVLGRGNPRRVARLMRWLIDGVAALAAGYFLLRRRIEFALVLGGVAFSILRFGRIGP